MRLATGSFLGPYEIVAWVGTGGMGVVYRARDPRLGREVAIKLLPEPHAADPSRVHRFEQEARAAGQLSHPNVLTVFDVGAHDGTLYVVAELLEGETLRSVLTRGALPCQRAVDYARQIADGLAAAHDKGIVHRDIKPENLFVTRSGRLKILDFGVAKLTSPDEVSPPEFQTDTDPNTVIGTSGYMSPEQILWRAGRCARGHLWPRRGAARDADGSARLRAADACGSDGCTAEGRAVGASAGTHPGVSGGDRVEVPGEVARRQVSIGARPDVRIGAPLRLLSACDQDA